MANGQVIVTHEDTSSSLSANGKAISCFTPNVLKYTDFTGDCDEPVGTHQMMSKDIRADTLDVQKFGREGTVGGCRVGNVTGRTFQGDHFCAEIVGFSEVSEDDALFVGREGKVPSEKEWNALFGVGTAMRGVVKVLHRMGIVCEIEERGGSQGDPGIEGNGMTRGVQDDNDRQTDSDSEEEDSEVKSHKRCDGAFHDIWEEKVTDSAMGRSVDSGEVTGTTLRDVKGQKYSEGMREGSENTDEEVVSASGPVKEQENCDKMLEAGSKRERSDRGKHSDSLVTYRCSECFAEIGTLKVIVFFFD